MRPIIVSCCGASVTELLKSKVDDIFNVVAVASWEGLADAVRWKIAGLGISPDSCRPGVGADSAVEVVRRRAPFAAVFAVANTLTAAEALWAAQAGISVLPIWRDSHRLPLIRSIQRELERSFDGKVRTASIGHLPPDTLDVLEALLSLSCRTVSVEQLAMAMAVSPRTLEERAHRHGGPSPGALVRWVRGLRAVWLISSGVAPKVASDWLGFASSASLGNQLRGLTGHGFRFLGSQAAFNDVLATYEEWLVTTTCAPARRCAPNPAIGASAVQANSRSSQ